MACVKMEIDCQSLKILMGTTLCFVAKRALYNSISFLICWSIIIGLFKKVYHLGGESILNLSGCVMLY